MQYLRDANQEPKCSKLVANVQRNSTSAFPSLALLAQDSLTAPAPQAYVKRVSVSVVISLQEREIVSARN